jgi:hypothetical protein
MKGSYRREQKAPLFLLSGLALIALCISLGCGYAYLDAGPNPARVVVSVKAQAPAASLPSRGDVVLWDWGLYLVGADGVWKRLGPTQPAKFSAMAANPLEQHLIFLAPPGKHKLVLSLEGYVMVEAGDQTVARTVAKYGDHWQVDLKPGQEWKIVKSYGTN